MVCMHGSRDKVESQRAIMHAKGKNRVGGKEISLPDARNLAVSSSRRPEGRSRKRDYGKESVIRAPPTDQIAHLNAGI